MVLHVTEYFVKLLKIIRNDVIEKGVSALLVLWRISVKSSVTISSDLSPVKHVGTISSSCFYWLRQIRRIRRSLDAESAKTLVHAFIASRIDGCNTVLAGSPRTTTDRLQRLLNAAARVVSNTGKFDQGLTHLLHSELHWLDVPQRILHKLGVTVHRCLQGKAPQYLVNICVKTVLICYHGEVNIRCRCVTYQEQFYDAKAHTGHLESYIRGRRHRDPEIATLWTHKCAKKM